MVENQKIKGDVNDLFSIIHLANGFYASDLYVNMLNTLNRLDFNNDMFVFTKEKHKEIPNVTNLAVLKKFDRFNYWYKQKKQFTFLEKNIDVSKYAICHAHTLFTNGGTAFMLKKKYGIKYIVAVRNTDVNVFLKYMPHLRSHGLKIMREAEKIVFLSPIYRDFVIKKYVPSAEQVLFLKKSLVLPNGIDEKWFESISEPKTLSEKQLRILYYGCIEKNKNVRTTIQAIDILEKNNYDVKLTIIGKIKDKKYYDSLPKYDYISFCNPLYGKELVNEVKKHDVFVMPSFHETFGLVYAEAMSCGIPVIYTKGQGFDGHFPEGKIGYSVNPTYPEEIADRIADIKRNYDELSMNCVNLARKFRWEDICGEYVKIYKEIIDS